MRQIPSHTIAGGSLEIIQIDQVNNTDKNEPDQDKFNDFGN